MGKGSQMKSKQIPQSRLKMRAAATVMALENKSTLRVAARVRKMHTEAPRDHL